MATLNERTVLFTSYNNHPINGVLEKLSSMSYRGKTIPFPVLRLGNIDKIKEAIDYIKELYQQAQSIQVFEDINQVMDYQKRNSVSMQMRPFQTDLQGRQLQLVEQKINAAGDFTNVGRFH